MARKLIIIGGVAGGASAAARARRLSEEAEIIIFERDRFISFANCGLPYHIGGEIKERDALLVQTPESMNARFNLDIRIQTEILAIDPVQQTVQARELNSGREYQESYDDLILSPGARPFVPPIPGIPNDKTFTLRNIPDMDRIIRTIHMDAPKSAVVIGGGFIGVEMAEALVQQNIETSLIELSNQIMAPVDPEMAVPLHEELRRHGVRLMLGQSVESMDVQDNALHLTLQNGNTVTTDLLILAIGVKPDTTLANNAGLEIGPRGGILVNERMETSVPHIYAVGDAIEVKDFISQEPALVPLAGPANRQGRIAADNIFGRQSQYGNTQGTAICKVFNYAVAATGSNEKALRRRGARYEKIYVHGADHATYYPGAKTIAFKLLFDPNDGRILGAQAVGEKGVDKRIDVMATMIRAGMTVFDMEEAELCYAPPFGSAKDVINQAGFVASNVIRGDHLICQPGELMDNAQDMLILDVRNADEVSACGEIEHAVNIPLPTLRQQLDQLPKDRTIVVYCAVGLRGYVAYRMLCQHGFKVKNLTGGYRSYQMFKHIGR
ncbi:FAD-dependent oxidoreductase [Gynuella sp.]|uniref:FAD-dependent oxidoreductase n=1 Tax=Gynuella sp. TaxID=2969146 RepID=UPI003D13ADD0